MCNHLKMFFFFTVFFIEISTPFLNFEAALILHDLRFNFKSDLAIIIIPYQHAIQQKEELVHPHSNAFRPIPRWIRLVMGFPKMPKLRMSIHFSVTKSTLKLCLLKFCMPVMC